MGYYEQNLLRKQEIEEGLLALMQEKQIREITVKDLTDKLHMARKTFYHYYESKWDCLKSLTFRIIEECSLAQLRNVSDTGDMQMIMRNRLEFWIEHKAYLDAINKSKLGDFLLNRIMDYLHRETDVRDVLSTPDVAYDEDILLFCTSGELYLLLKWCADGFSLPVEQMVKKMLRLMQEPMVCSFRK